MASSQIICTAPVWVASGYQVSEDPHLNADGSRSFGGVIDAIDGTEFRSSKFEDVVKRLRAHLKNKHISKISLYFEKIVGSDRQFGSIILRMNKGAIYTYETTGFSFPLVRPAPGELLPEDDFCLTNDDVTAFVTFANTILFGKIVSM